MIKGIKLTEFLEKHTDITLNQLALSIWWRMLVGYIVIYAGILVIIYFLIGISA